MLPPHMLGVFEQVNKESPESSWLLRWRGTWHTVATVPTRGSAMITTYRKPAIAAILVMSASATTFAQTKLSPTDADAQISTLADRIEQELLSNQTMPNDIAATFQRAITLLPNASDAGRKVFVELPQRLRNDANERKVHSEIDGNLAKAINLTVVAEFIDGQGIKATPISTAQPPPPKPTTPIIVTPNVQIAPPIAAITPLDQSLMQRGDAMLKQGNVEAARMLYERAASDGVGSAALKLGETYDAAFLASHHLIGPKPNPQQAEAWYRKASALGEAEAERRLRTMADKE